MNAVLILNNDYFFNFNFKSKFIKLYKFWFKRVLKKVFYLKYRKKKLSKDLCKECRLSLRKKFTNSSKLINKYMKILLNFNNKNYNY